MAGQENLQIVREIFAAWNAHDIEAFTKRLDQKTVWESDAFPAPFSGHEGARQFFKLYVGAFPDLHLDIEQILAVDPYVIVRWRSTGTHLGRLGDIQPTARKVSLHGCSVMEVKAMKGSHTWVYFDNAHLLRQIGALPGH
jgi:predicted ester cyclase